MKLGRQIKNLRESKNYTQEYLAKCLDITQRAYSKIENDEVSLSVEKLKRISDVLEVEISAFFDANAKHVYNNLSSYQKGGNAVVINQAEKAIELYEKLLIEKDAHIEALKKIIFNLEEGA